MVVFVVVLKESIQSLTRLPKKPFLGVTTSDFELKDSKLCPRPAAVQLRALREGAG